MTTLVLGPLLRHVGETDAIVWVETDGPARVDVLAGGARGSARTFAIAGHHYGIVRVDGLEAGTVTPYEVRLDDDPVWPAADSTMPPSVIRTPDGSRDLEVAFGSCRVCTPHEEPYTLTKNEDPRGREVDALRAMALRMADEPVERRPHALIMLGDQIYADEVSPETKAFIRSRRDVGDGKSGPDGPGETVADFEEYTRLYHESWGEPVMRWLLSTVPTSMIFDDHDVHDDWNTSKTWVDTMRARPWWEDRIVGGFMSYWLYQHLGNLSPEEIAADATFSAILAADDEEEATRILQAFARRADREIEGTRWSFRRDFGGVRLLMVDSRAGRVLTPGARSMLDEREWQWLDENMTGDVDHLLIGTSLPWLLAPGMHFLEAWSEAICDGAFGSRAARLGERVRQALDLEHWAAFHASFERMAHLVGEVASGRRGRAPASIVFLSGDVHHAYLAEVAYPRSLGVTSPVYQAVCSPFRNPLGSREQYAIRFLTSRTCTIGGRLLARTARVPDPPIRWRFAHKRPVFDNQIATLHLDDRAAELTLERTEKPTSAEERRHPRLMRSFYRHLTEETFEARPRLGFSRKLRESVGRLT